MARGSPHITKLNPFSEALSLSVLRPAQASGQRRPLRGAANRAHRSACSRVLGLAAGIREHRTIGRRIPLSENRIQSSCRRRPKAVISILLARYRPRIAAVHCSTIRWSVCHQSPYTIVGPRAEWPVLARRRRVIERLLAHIVWQNARCDSPIGSYKSGRRRTTTS